MAPGHSADEQPARKPSYVYAVGTEPDPRFSLANERTFLSWVRTALAMLAGAVALHSLELPQSSWLRGIVVVTLLIVGALCTLLAFIRWAKVERAMRLREPLPPFSLGWLLTGAVVLVSILLAVTLTVG
jgi:putative membrane protein